LRIGDQAGADGQLGNIKNGPAVIASVRAARSDGANCGCLRWARVGDRFAFGEPQTSASALDGERHYRE
jgi:hypothetical protein